MKYILAILFYLLSGCLAVNYEKGLDPFEPMGVLFHVFFFEIPLELGSLPCLKTSTSELVTSEDPQSSQATVGFAVELCGIPGADVIVPDLKSNNREEGELNVSSIVFSALKWEPQVVLVMGVDDDSVDGDQVYTITMGNTLSADVLYNDLAPENYITVTNLDDDAPRTK